MYESFFGLTERPFAAAAVAKRYFPAAATEAARQTLTRCLERAEGTALLTGPAGTGKSMLCQVLAAQFCGRMDVSLLTGGHLANRRALLQAILYELGLPYRGMEEGDLRLSLIDHLSPRDPSQTDASAGLLLIVDEAHTLPLRLLDELRLITNLIRKGQPRVRLVLAGGPQLEERFASPKLASFNQRVASRCYLEPFDRQQTADFVQHQIQQLHGDVESIFTADALDAVFNATDGIPRLVNQVCDHALLLAYSGGVRTLTASGIEEAWSDLQQLPTPWSARSGEIASAEKGSKGVIEFGQLDERGDDLPAALPFRAPATADAANPKNPVAQIEAIEKQLFEMEDDFQPAGSIRPEMELVFQSTSNPFQEPFEEEEVVLDRYSAVEADALANRPLVTSSESRELGALLTPFVRDVPPSVAIAAASWPGGTPNAATETQRPLQTAVSDRGWPSPQTAAVQTMVAAGSGRAVETSNITRSAAADDSDLIVVEDPPERTVSVPKSAPRVRRQEYRQLFAQLRRG